MGLGLENATISLGNPIIHRVQEPITDDRMAELADDDPKSFYSQTFYGQLCWLFRRRQTWLFLSCSSGALFLVFALLVIFLRSRIDVAVMLIGEGSK